MGRAPLVLLVGTRPEAIKLAPLLRELAVRALPAIVVTTGQHPLLADAMLAESGFRADCDLGIHSPGRLPAALLALLLERLPPLLAALKPRLLIVQGDTLSAFGGALAGSYARVPVAHVEAGLRTGDRADPFPEESHRRLVAQLATLHFAPTPAAARALRREGVGADAIAVTGNTGIDALLHTVERLGRNRVLAARMHGRYPFVLAPGPPILLATVHRRENVGARLPAIADGLAAVVRSGMVRLLLPQHPNPAIATILGRALAGLPNCQLLDPLDHADMVWLMLQSRLLLTDSGGLQEEAPALGLATLVLRANTERPEAIACGTARLIGADGSAIPAAVAQALLRPAPPPAFPFGDGTAALRIADGIEQWLAGARRPWPRPALLQPA